MVHKPLFIFLQYQSILTTYALTRPTYEPSRVSISIVSPSLMNKGTRTSAPVSTVAGFKVLVAVSPFNPVLCKLLSTEL